jgi:hypothetical protein
MDVLYRYIKCASPWWTISTQFTLSVVPHQGCEGQTGRYRSSQDGQCHSHWLWQLTAVLWQRRQLDHEHLTAFSSYLSNVSKAIIQHICRNPALSLLRNSRCPCTCNFQTHVYRRYERENWPWQCLLQAQVCSIGVDSKSLKSAWIYKATLIFLWGEKNPKQCCYKKSPLSVPDTSRPELIQVAKC